MISSRTIQLWILAKKAQLMLFKLTWRNKYLGVQVLDIISVDSQWDNQMTPDGSIPMRDITYRYRRSRFMFIKSSIMKGTQIRCESAFPMMLSTDHSELANRVYNLELKIKQFNQDMINRQLLIQ